MLKLDKAGEKFISSKALLSRTGISRATLNNYINMGIISPPIIRKPDDPASKARQIGYFRDTVAGTIEKIGMYKREGRCMKEIISLLSLKNKFFLESHHAGEQADDSATDNMECPSAEVRKRVQGDHCSGGKEIARREASVGDIEQAGDLSLSDHKFLKQRVPVLVSFSVLVAKLQDSVRICAEMPPDEHFVLIHQIWECMEDSFRRYCGTYAKHTRDGMSFYFLKDRNSKYLINTILCAIDVRERMKKLNDEWKRNKGWFNELSLNIGMNEGKEYFETIPIMTIELTPIGNTEHYASHLSDIARLGSIWTTKNLMNRLTDEERKKIHYGIHHRKQEQDILVDSTFLRTMDLNLPTASSTITFQDMATVPVTEILNLR
jgi:class 3 adenylate cyclase